MSREDHTEVLVVGAGPVGMFTALLLAQEGIRVRIIDQATRTGARSYACALHPTSLKLLDQVGVGQEVAKYGRFIDTVGFHDEGGKITEFKLAELALDRPCLFVISQSTFENLLELKLSQAHHVEVEWNWRLAQLEPRDGEVVADVEKLIRTAKGYIVPEWDWVVGRTLRTHASIVVGADGHNSRVRQLLGIGYEEIGPEERYAVYEFEMAADAAPSMGSEMKIVIGAEGKAVMWPLADRLCRWSFQIDGKEDSGEFPEKDRRCLVFSGTPDDEARLGQLRRFISERAPWFQLPGGRLSWRAMDIHFESRLAESFAQGRCVLAGDAAHQTGPIGMQSMNMGLREAAAIVAHLKKILRNKSSSETLGDYSNEYREEWLGLLGRKGAPKPSAQMTPWMRDHAKQLTACLPATGKDLRLMFARLGFVVS